MMYSRVFLAHLSGVWNILIALCGCESVGCRMELSLLKGFPTNWCLCSAGSQVQPQSSLGCLQSKLAKAIFLLLFGNHFEPKTITHSKWRSQALEMTLLLCASIQIDESTS